MEGNFCENSLPLFSFHQAVQDDNMEEVKRFLSAKSCDSEEFGFKGQEYLVIEDEACSVAHCKRTVKSRVSLVEDARGYTPLHFAHNSDIAKFFLDQGLDIEAPSDIGSTPLRKAIIDNRIETARFLFEQGANPYSETGFKTPWSEAKLRSKWYTFSLNRLIKDFDEVYTPPKADQSDTAKEGSQNIDEP